VMATTLANFLIATPFSPHSPGTEPSTADLIVLKRGMSVPSNLSCSALKTAVATQANRHHRHSLPLQ
jgi:hypothetical protein